MKTSFLAFSFMSVLALTACSQAEAPVVETGKVKEMAVKASEVMDTKTKAVLIYADWCGSCKVLDPKIEKVKSMSKVPGVEFVTLDYTAKDADAFYAQADAAGVSAAVKTYLDGTIKTGQLLLVDLDDQTVIGKVTKTLEPAEILTAIKDAVKAS